MLKKALRQLQAPFWSRIPLFGVRKYPKTALRRSIFWISAVVYSALYFYCIALAVVVFSHALWVWPGLQSYITTTLYDICYRNWWLMLLFIGLEVALIYQAATARKPRPASIYREKVDWHRLLTQPVLFVAVLYLTLKFFTGNYSLEPNITPVLILTYVFSVAALYIVDKYS